MYLSQIIGSRWKEDMPMPLSVKFSGADGNIECNLTPEEVNDLMKALGEVLIRHSQAAAKRLEQASLQTLGLLIEAKPNESVNS